MTSGSSLVETLAHVDQDELWARADRLRRARDRVVELAVGLPARARHLLGEIDAVHARVERAERAVTRAWVPHRAATARRELDAAYAAEQAVLERAGFASWTAFALRRIEVHVDPDAAAALADAEVEAARAEMAWRVVAGPVDVDAALAARPGIGGAAETARSATGARAGAPQTSGGRVVTHRLAGIRPSRLAGARWPARRLAAG